MTTTTAQANGVTSPDNWTLGAGASKTAAVNASDDDDTSYIASGTSSNTVQTFTVSPSLASGSTITQIQVRARHRRPPAGSNANFVIGYSFTPDGGGTQTGESGTLVATISWASDTYTHSSLSVIWGSGLTIYAKNTQNREVWISTLEITITYTPPAGGTAVAVIMHHLRQQEIS